MQKEYDKTDIFNDDTYPTIKTCDRKRYIIHHKKLLKIFLDDNEREIKIPAGITVIADKALPWCERIYIPYTVKHIHDIVAAAYYVDKRNNNYSDVNGMLLSKDRQTLYMAHIKNNDDLPNVRVICKKSLYYDDSMSEIIIPDSVQTIEEEALCGRNIKYIKIGKGVKHLHKLGYVPNVEKVDLSDSIVSLDGTFDYNCEKLHTVNLPSKLRIIGKRIFSNCHKLSYLNIPRSVIFIAKNAFCDCDCNRIDYGGCKFKWKIVSHKSNRGSVWGHECTVVCTNGLTKIYFPRSSDDDDKSYITIKIVD